MYYAVAKYDRRACMAYLKEWSSSVGSTTKAILWYTHSTVEQRKGLFDYYQSNKEANHGSIIWRITLSLAKKYYYRLCVNHREKYSFNLWYSLWSMIYAGQLLGNRSTIGQLSIIPFASHEKRAIPKRKKDELVTKTFSRDRSIIVDYSQFVVVSLLTLSLVNIRC